MARVEVPMPQMGESIAEGTVSQWLKQIGDTVERGEIIGYVGSTGRATGSHVHYEVLVNGRTLNPLRLLPDTDAVSAN